MSFSQHGPRAVCILSANGAISNVTLRQPATSGGTVTYEVCQIANNFPAGIPLLFLLVAGSCTGINMAVMRRKLKLRRWISMIL